MTEMSGLEQLTLFDTRNAVVKPRRKTNPITPKMGESFYRLANIQGITPDKPLNDYAAMIELLSNTLKVRSLNGEGSRMPLYSCLPDHIDQLTSKFVEEYREAQAEVEKGNNEYDFAKFMYNGLIEGGFSLNDYPDRICDAAELARIIPLNLKSGAFDPRYRKGIKGQTREEIIDYGYAALRKYHFKTVAKGH